MVERVQKSVTRSHWFLAIGTFVVFLLGVISAPRSSTFHVGTIYDNDQSGGIGVAHADTGGVSGSGSITTGGGGASGCSSSGASTGSGGSCGSACAGY